MLSSADADLVRRDQAIIGMKVVMDPDALAAALRTARPQLNVTTAQLTYIRYRPTRSCLGTYHIETKDAAAPMLIHVTAYNKKAWAKLSTPISDHYLALQDQVLVSFFPGDAKLTSLTELMNRDNRQNMLKRLLPTNDDFKTIYIETLAYKPERRYVARVHGKHGASALLKHYRKCEYQKSALATMIDCPTTTRLRIPRTLRRSSHHQSLVFEWLPGQPLDAEITTAPITYSLYASGAALAEFHSLAIDNLAQRTRSMQVDKLNAIAATIGQLHPPLVPLAHDLAMRIGQKLAQEAPAAQRIHGDFYAKQVVLMTDDQVAIIDHDENVCGDPMEDLGLFIAHLLRDNYNDRIAGNHAVLMIEALIEGYQTTAQQQVNRSLHSHIAAGLFSLTHMPFRTHTANWPEDTRVMLEHINDMLHSPHSATCLPRGQAS